MALFNWIFAKPKKQEKQQQTWTIERNGWEVGARTYNKLVGLPENSVLGER